MNSRVVVGVIGPAALVAGAWYGVVLRPHNADIASAQERAARATQQLAATNALLAKAKSTPTDPEATKRELVELSTALPPTSQIGEFIGATGEIASAAGVTMVSNDATPPAAVPTDAQSGAATPATKSPALATIPVEQSLSGSRDALLDYEGRLLDLKRLVVLDSQTLTSEGETWNLRVSLRIFVAG